MAQVIKVKPDKDGRLFVRLYGNDIEIVVDDKKAAPKKSDDEK